MGWHFFCCQIICTSTELAGAGFHRACAMNNEHREFLNLRRLPGSIDAEQTSVLLGIKAASVTILVNKGFLKPLGKNLAANAAKWFSSAAIEDLIRNPEDMSRMHHIISSHWRTRNGTVLRNDSSGAKPGRN